MLNIMMPTEDGKLFGLKYITVKVIFQCIRVESNISEFDFSQCS